jgi:D-alanyl-D-alanine carboxypeptidase (penicillin-binding protein 5/6)
MLPSGNDASIAIAVWGGKVLLKSSTPITKKKICYQRFITEMNNKAKKLGMQKTNYANSHGLVNSANKSCAYDIAILCEYAMSNKKFRNIVSTKQYRTNISFCYRNTSVSLTEKKSMTSLRLSVGDRERIN